MTVRLIILVIILTMGVGSILGQVATPELLNYDKDGLKFRYPSDWTLTDRSTAENQYLLLSKPNSLILIGIVSPREVLTDSKQFWKVRDLVNNKYFEAIETGLGIKDGTGEVKEQCLDFNGRKVPGKRFSGIYRKESSAGEIYPFALGDRLVGLIYLHSDKDEAAGEAVWRDAIRSLSLAGSNKDTSGLDFNTELLDGGKVNGKAIKLADPGYPLYAQSIGAVIDVSVVIDEQGNVISADAPTYAEKNFRNYAIAAALKSKFAPTTVCGKPIQVRGHITYNFAGPGSRCDVGVPTRRC